MNGIPILQLFLALSTHSVTLEASGDLKLKDFHNTQVTRAGDILFGGLLEVWHFDSNGRLLLRVGLTGREVGQKDRLVANFFYCPRRGIYWLVDSLEQESFFYDAKGHFLGKGFFEDKQGEENGQKVYFRYITKAGSGIFGIDASKLVEWPESPPLVLQKLAFDVTPRGVAVRRIGPPFCAVRPILREFNFNFKNFWIVPRGYSLNLFVVDQLSKSWRFFEYENHEYIEESEAKHSNPLYLEHWVDLPPDFKRKGLQEMQSGTMLFTSFSRITGFYPFGDHLLVGYTVPNSDRLTYRTALQRISIRGYSIGDAVLVEGNLLGTDGKRVYILETDPSSDSVKMVRMVTFDD